MADGLKPCPFCGGKAAMRKVSGNEVVGYCATVSVSCQVCHVSISASDKQNANGWSIAKQGETEAAAIAKWNTRATPPADVIAAMERALVWHADDSSSQGDLSRAALAKLKAWRAGP